MARRADLGLSEWILRRCCRTAFGYADQPQLIHECRQMALTTPRELDAARRGH